MLEVIPFCLVLGSVIGAVAVLDIFAVKESKEKGLERPDYIDLED